MSNNQRERIRAAACACGQLRVSCRGEPSAVTLCHCLQCQRRTGSAFGIGAFFDRGVVQTDGEAATFARVSDAGIEVRFHFCKVCGSTVYWETERRPGHLAVAAGCFADPDFPAPRKAVFSEHRHPWISLPEWP